MAYKSKKIPIDDLLLDDKNPRLPKSLHNKEQKDIIEYLLLEASTIELMQAIAKNDFFPGEQLLVTPKTSNKYKVVEGNRRLASVKLLNDLTLTNVKKIAVKQVYDEAKYWPNIIPCIVFETEDEIRKYIGFRHITGIKSWGLSEKARYLSELKDSSFNKTTIDYASKELAKIIGSRRDYVKRVLIGYEIYKKIEDEDFFSVKDLNDTNFYIGYIIDSLSRANIVQFLGIDFNKENPLEAINYKNLEKWTYWFFEKNSEQRTRIKGKSNDLNMLNAVLNNKVAIQAFKDGDPLAKAYELTKDYDYMLKDSIKKTIDNLELADKVILKVNDFYATIDDDLDYIQKLLKRIRKTKAED